MNSTLMLEFNRIYNCDVLEGLSHLADSSVDCIITSPPYNKAGFNGRKTKCPKTNWQLTIDYGGDMDVDCMPESEYEDWQIRVLNECFRVLKDDGSMFYNHKVRIKDNQISHPLEWIARSAFRCRQIITWDRCRLGPNISPIRYIPESELIFWLAKGKENPRFKRSPNCQFKGDVWRIPPQVNTEHPAPFPEAIPDNILDCMPEGIVVLDPFMGSGTVAVSAVKHHDYYIGFELFPEYITMADDRLREVPGWTVKWGKGFGTDVTVTDIPVVSGEIGSM